MAKTILPIAGAVVGAFFGAPQIGFAIGSLLASAIPGEAQGPRIGETGAQTSQEGAARAIIYGTCACTGNVIASGPLIKRDVEENQGGKGGTDVSNEHAYRTFAVRICEGPIAGYLRIWEDDKLVYDVRTGSSMLAESALWAQGVVFYLGGEDQLPDPSLQMIFGTDEVPAHRGSAYIVFIERDLTDRRGSIPQYRAEVASGVTLSSIRAPLVVNPWAVNAGRPMHSSGETNFKSGVSFATWTDYADAVEGAAADYAAVYASDPVRVTSGGSKTFVAFKSSTNDIASPMSGGANVGDDPQSVTYLMGYESPSSFFGPNGGCPEMQATLTEVSSYVDRINGYTPVLAIGINGLVQPPDPAGYSMGVLCAPMYGFLNQMVSIVVQRTPSPARDLITPTVVAGTAKQLCAIEYRDGVLYQNALGPVLLPDDENYDNDDFWSSARDAAILVGGIALDVDWPVIVDSYVDAYKAGTGSAMPLADIVSDIHARCNFPADKFDVSELDDMVTGLVLAGDYTGADAINTLRSLYLFDRADYDKQIHYPKRGAAVVATLTIDDLVEEPDTSTRQQAIEYPKKLHLTFQAAITGYAPAQATSARSSPDVRVVGETTVQVPVVLDVDQAAQAANILHKVAWAEAEGEVKLSIPDSFIRLVPSNCLGLSLRGRVSRLRIEQMDVADGVIALTMRYDRQSAYTSNVTGIPLPAPTPPPSTIVGDTVLAVLDISPRADSEDDLHYLVAVTGGMPAWHGATVQRSLDAGANYTTAASISRASVMGSLVNDLSDASEHYTDTTNVIRVQLYRDTQTIEELTDVQFLSEGGAFAIMRPDGSCEVLQYRDATEVSTGVYDLSYLHRGLLNSGTSSHLEGALLVMLNRAEHITAQSAWIGADLTHRAPSFDQSPELAAEQTETYTGKSQTEWPVAYLTLSRDGGDVITGSWTPRFRFGTDDAPINSSNMTGYRVSLDDGVLAPVTFDTTVPNFTHDASALGSPLTVSVSALNRITGAGPAESGSV